ncbi:MAG TPA: carboxymuconolactone decarboxylase family protein [Bryobacteraceae bacterium]|nr:carboxymuconolactone decarboxylase family protein [Bryobacteraceae bacterium]
MQTKFGFVPNLIGVLAESPAALKGYLALADAFAASSLSPVEQQVVLLTTSLENRCTYCVAAHSMLYRHSGGDEASLRALRDGEPLADPRLEAVRSFTRRVVENRGWVDEETVRAFLDAGFTRAQVLEVILGITQKTLSNYTNHVAETPVDNAFANFAWQPRTAVPGTAR